MITDVTDRPATNFLVNAPVECSVSSSLTSLETLYIEHKWTVDSFAVHMDLSPVAEYLTSPVFGSKDNRYKFNLRLYPTGKDEECRSYVSLFLMIRECPGQKIRFKVNFFVETTDGPKYCALNRHVVTINKGGIVTASKFFAVEFLKNRSQRFLPNDTLTVGVQLAIFGDTISSDVSQDNINLLNDYANPDSSLYQDFQLLLDNELHTDCQLIVLNDNNNLSTTVFKDEETDSPGPSSSAPVEPPIVPENATIFKCHKSILSARSPVFAAMFDHDMKEANSSQCKIDDLTPEAVRAILQFLYSGTCPQIEEFAEEILPAADKYQIILLKSRCEHRLAGKISLENVCRYLKLADKHSAPLLRQKSLAFFQEHKKDVLTSNFWDSLETEDPQLAAQTLRQLLTGGNSQSTTSSQNVGGISSSSTTNETSTRSQNSQSLYNLANRNSSVAGLQTNAAAKRPSSVLAPNSHFETAASKRVRFS
uniref:Uncharacterized protein n=1 Tax=Romanomermis culicivorax TaxID=13658 RepID=A0A915K4G0_ROMCU